MGELADWETAEAALAAALDESGAAWVRNEGDGAFYGPKIDVIITGNIYACMFFVQVLTVVEFRLQMPLAATTNVEPFN